MSVAATPTRTEFDREVEEALAETPDDETYAGWYCVKTKPFPCPAPGCDAVLDYMTAAHLIVVWPSSDDRSLLRFAADARQFGRDPQIIEYQPAFGHCIAYDAWVAIGRPIHGKLDRPDDQPFRRF